MNLEQKKVIIINFLHIYSIGFLWYANISGPRNISLNSGFILSVLQRFLMICSCRVKGYYIVSWDNNCSVKSMFIWILVHAIKSCSNLLMWLNNSLMFESILLILFSKILLCLVGRGSCKIFYQNFCKYSENDINPSDGEVPILELKKYGVPLCYHYF